MKEPREFIINYWGCSWEELERWEEKVDKLGFADFDNILDLMKEYAKLSIEEYKKDNKL